MSHLGVIHEAHNTRASFRAKEQGVIDVHIDICIHTCMCVYVYIYIYTHIIPTHEYIYIHTYTYACVYMYYTNIQVCVSVKKSARGLDLPAYRVTGLPTSEITDAHMGSSPPWLLPT